ncbi:hypothetical protein [Epibacterium ulvae]|uniref:hypothetical protein n=1 Tax=Epibacterium ulvae TaxID=1156985 RepID=UPI0024937EC7|nr:hypothetical protein [Epibacterium ulvae]
MGNHDDEAVAMLPWDSISDIKAIKDSSQALVLCHYPMITWNGARRGALQLLAMSTTNGQARATASTLASINGIFTRCKSGIFSAGQGSCP